MTESHPDERRPCSRVRPALHAELRVGDALVRLELKNVSLTGACLPTDATFPVGASCHLTLLLEGGEEPLRCEIEGQVIRNGPGEVGIQFTEVAGLESYEHLHNIILNNAPEPERVVEEFEHHIGLRRKD